MSKIEIRGVIVPSNYDLEWMREYIEKGVLTPESYIRKQIDMADKNKPLEMYINSPGGSVFAAYEIINAITQWKMENKQPVNITVGAMAASAASAISVLSSANIKMFRNSKLMFHGAWSETVGGAEAHQDTADLLQKINADIKAALIGKYSIPVDVVDSWFAEGRQGWMSADEAIKYKMADEIIDGDDMEIEFVDTDVASIEANGLAIAAMVKKDDVKNLQDVAVVAEALQEIAEEKKDDSGKSADAAEDGNSPEEIATKSDDESKPDESSKPEGLPETESNGSDSAQPSVDELVENKLNDRLADHKQQIDKLMVTLSKTEKSRAMTQGKLDAEIAARAKDQKQFEERLAATQEALKQANARLTKLTLGSLTFSPVIETWPEALSACGGDYAKARKQYPDAYAQFMSNNNKR